MEQIDMEVLWEVLTKATSDRVKAEQNFRLARKALVSRLCDCYREDEGWEERATWCAKRILNQCPYYLEFRKRTI